MGWIYLSPHFDDAALCAGGLIYDQCRAGEQVEICTIMSGIPPSESLTPYARVMHKKWSTTTAKQTVKLRRDEDRRAAEILGARTTHLDFLDAIYRTTAAGDPLYGDPVGAPLRQEDALLIRDIASQLRRRLRAADIVVCLLGIGNHADHVLVRRAAEAAGHPLQYVADFPYVTTHPETITPSVESLESRVLPVSAAGVVAWIQSVQAYASQLGAVFGDSRPDELIRSYWAPLQGIRLWA